MKIFFVAILSAALPTFAASDTVVIDPWARASILASRPGAAYLTMHSDNGDRLIAIESQAAGHIMLHSTETDANGVSRMMHIEQLDLPPGQPVLLAPGGKHLMLMNLGAKLEEGSSFALTLRFETAGDITVDVPVLAATATGLEGAE